MPGRSQAIEACIVARGVEKPSNEGTRREMVGVAPRNAAALWRCAARRRWVEGTDAMSVYG